MHILINAHTIFHKIIIIVWFSHIKHYTHIHIKLKKQLLNTQGERERETYTCVLNVYIPQAQSYSISVTTHYAISATNKLKEKPPFPPRPNYAKGYHRHGNRRRPVATATGIAPRRSDPNPK